MNFEFNWNKCSSLRNGARQGIERDVKSTLKRCFKHADGIAHIRISASGLVTGADSVKGVKITNGDGKTSSSNGGVPVIVRTIGTQGLRCHIKIDDLSDDFLKEAIQTGSFVKQKEDIVTDKVNDETKTSTYKGESTTHLSEGVTVSDEKKKIDAELTCFGLAQNDLECLRVFYLELVEKYFKGQTEGNVFVLNKNISALIRDCFPSLFGRGQIGNVYSARVRPFAESVFAEGGVVSKGWNFKAKKVLDFIGGNLIPKMACPHPHNINSPAAGSISDSYPGIHDSVLADKIPLDDLPVSLNIDDADEALNKWVNEGQQLVVNLRVRLEQTLVQKGLQQKKLDEAKLAFTKADEVVRKAEEELVNLKLKLSQAALDVEGAENSLGEIETKSTKLKSSIEILVRVSVK